MEKFNRSSPEIKTNEIKLPSEKAQDVKPKTEMKLKEAKEFLKNIFSGSIFKEVDNPEWGVKYNKIEDAIEQTPIDKSRGDWDGERGLSRFAPSSETAEGKACVDKLKEYGKNSIEYRNGEPDFSDISEKTVKIDKMSEYRPNNFAQADKICAEEWNKENKDGRTNWTKEDVHAWRKSHHFSWHERCDTKTMDLVPEEIHKYCDHLGGVSECRIRDHGKNWGGFDE